MIINPISISFYNWYKGKYDAIYINGDGILGTESFAVEDRLSAASLETSEANIETINGKTLPAYPPDEGTFIPKCINGVLTWVEE